MVAVGGLNVIIVDIHSFSRKIDFDGLVARRIVEVLLADTELPAFAITEQVKVARVGDECAVVIPATKMEKIYRYNTGF